MKRAPKAQQGWTWVAELERNKENSWRIGLFWMNETEWHIFNLQNLQCDCWSRESDNAVMVMIWQFWHVDKSEWCVQRGKWLKDVEDTGREKQEDTGREKQIAAFATFLQQGHLQQWISISSRRRWSCTYTWTAPSTQGCSFALPKST